jgi:hypothetical protein
LAIIHGNREVFNSLVEKGASLEKAITEIKVKVDERLIKWNDSQYYLELGYLLNEANGKILMASVGGPELPPNYETTNPTWGPWKVVVLKRLVSPLHLAVIFGRDDMVATILKVIPHSQ